MDGYFSEKQNPAVKQKSGGRTPGARQGGTALTDEKIDIIVWMVAGIAVALLLTQLGVFTFIGGGLASMFGTARIQGWVDMIAVLIPYALVAFSILLLKFSKQKV